MSLATALCNDVHRGRDLRVAQDHHDGARVGAAGNATFAQRRALVELLIDRVVVTNDEVEIHYVIPTSPAGARTRSCHVRNNYFEQIG